MIRFVALYLFLVTWAVSIAGIENTNVVLCDTFRVLQTTGGKTKIFFEKSLLRKDIPGSLVAPVNFRDKGYWGYRFLISEAEHPEKRSHMSNSRIYFNAGTAAYWLTPFDIICGKPVTVTGKLYDWNMLPHGAREKFLPAPSDWEGGIGSLMVYTHALPDIAEMGRFKMHLRWWISLDPNWRPPEFTQATSVDRRYRGEGRQMAGGFPLTVLAVDNRICNVQGRLVGMLNQSGPLARGHFAFQVLAVEKLLPICTRFPFVPGNTATEKLRALP